MTNEEYFFIEWMIIEKKITAEKYATLLQEDKLKLLKEYINFRRENLTCGTI